MRRRSSGILAMLAMLDAISLLWNPQRVPNLPRRCCSAKPRITNVKGLLLGGKLGNDLGRSAGFVQLLFSRLREVMRVHVELLPEFAVAEDLHQRRRARHQPLGLERLDVDLAVLEAQRQVAQVDGEDLLLEARVGEAAL